MDQNNHSVCKLLVCVLCMCKAYEQLGVKGFMLISMHFLLVSQIPLHAQPVNSEYTFHSCLRIL